MFIPKFPTCVRSWESTEVELVSSTGKLLEEAQYNTLERHRRRKKEWKEKVLDHDSDLTLWQERRKESELLGRLQCRPDSLSHMVSSEAKMTEMV